MPFFDHGLCDRRAGGFESHAPGTKKKGSHCWEPIKSVVGDEGCPRAAGAARFRFGPAALACCAGKRFAFPQLRTLSGSNPSAMGLKKRKASIAGGLTIQWWAMRDVACGWRRPHPLRRSAPRVLRWKTLRVSSAPHPGGFESHEMGANKTVPLRGPFPIQWWAMRDSNPQPCACKAPALTVAPIARAERV